MASCCYHVAGAAPAASSSSCATFVTSPQQAQSTQTAAGLPSTAGLYLTQPLGGILSSDSSLGLATGRGFDTESNCSVELRAKWYPNRAASFFDNESPYAGLVATAVENLTQAQDPFNMTQLMGVPQNPDNNCNGQHQQSGVNTNSNSNNILSAGQPTRNTSTTGMVAPTTITRNSHSNASSTESGGTSKKSKRSSCKSTYKHVPHREKAPHLVARRNARERRRVQAVNTAFVRLRRHVPHENRHKRLSKVKTLHFAIDYINYMQRLINEYDAAVQRAGGAVGVGHHHHHHHHAGGGGVGGGGGGGPRVGDHGAAGGSGGSGAVGIVPGLPSIDAMSNSSCRLQSATAIDMVELNSTKENRWMPVNLPSQHAGDQARGLFLSADSYGQYHQG